MRSRRRPENGSKEEELRGGAKPKSKRAARLNAKFSFGIIGMEICVEGVGLSLPSPSQADSGFGSSTGREGGRERGALNHVL